jgi:large subunit ribosomal protein L7Ae
LIGSSGYVNGYGGFGRPFMSRSSRRGAAAAQQERQITDADIRKQEFLFVPEAAAPAADTTAKVQWPRYVRLQRQRRILAQRLKVPAPLNQFTFTADKPLALRIFKFLDHYKPETQKAKAERLKKAAEASAGSLAPAAVATGKAIEYGIKDVTTLVEAGRAQLVVIASDVDPIEIVVWLPALCRRIGVPYVIVKTKARLGAVVGLNTTSAIAIAEVKSEHKKELQQILDAVTADYTNVYKDRINEWGGGVLSDETIEKLRAQGKHD